MTQSYTVKAGDNPSKIAARLYGSQRFFNLIQNAAGGVLQPGMVLRLPDNVDTSAEGIRQHNVSNRDVAIAQDRAGQLGNQSTLQFIEQLKGQGPGGVGGPTRSMSGAVRAGSEDTRAGQSTGGSGTLTRDSNAAPFDPGAREDRRFNQGNLRHRIDNGPFQPAPRRGAKNNSGAIRPKGGAATRGGPSEAARGAGTRGGPNDATERNTQIRNAINLAVTGFLSTNPIGSAINATRAGGGPRSIFNRLDTAATKAAGGLVRNAADLVDRQLETVEGGGLSAALGITGDSIRESAIDQVPGIAANRNARGGIKAGSVQDAKPADAGTGSLTGGDGSQDPRLIQQGLLWDVYNDAVTGGRREDSPDKNLQLQQIALEQMFQEFLFAKENGLTIDNRIHNTLIIRDLIRPTSGGLAPSISPISFSGGTGYSRYRRGGGGGGGGGFSFPSQGRRPQGPLVVSGARAAGSPLTQRRGPTQKFRPGFGLVSWNI